MDGSRQPGIAGRLQTAALVGALKAAAEPTRLRMLVLLAAGELNVKDLTRHPRAEPAAHQPASEAAGRGRAGRARFRRAAGSISTSPTRARAVGWRGSPCGRRPRRSGARPRPRAGRGPEAGARERRRRPTSRPTPPNGTASAPCTSPRATWRRRSPRRSGPGPFDLLVDLGTGTGRMLELLRASATSAASAST